MQFSYPFMGTSLLPPAVSNDEVAVEFSEQIADLTAKEAGKVGNRTPEAGKAWKAQRAAPDSASMITAARRHPKVRRWLLWKIAGDWSRVMSPEVLTELNMFLVRTAEGDGPTARQARALLHEIHRPMAGTEAPAGHRLVHEGLPGPAGGDAIASGQSSRGSK